MCGDKMLDSFITKYKNKFPTSSIIILEEIGINNLGGNPNNSNYRFAALCRWGIKARKFQPTTKL